MFRRKRLRLLSLAFGTAFATIPAQAELDLGHVSVARLKNGLTVLVLEEHAMPVVSVQMLYMTGARDESDGKTGLAHFMEHMAFRASKNFPDTQLASAIYAVGGEWHAYTWLDQTTYFETAPKENLQLLLRIEADRMVNLLIPPKEVDAERGAVLAEMHGYQNDPASVLHDDLMYTVFQAHPYRNNTIGWESDVDNVTYADLKDFYKWHYRPRNAVLAVVGDVTVKDVVKSAERWFGRVPGGARTPLPQAKEPPQQGARRFDLVGAVPRKYFEIAYRAPSVRSPDYAAFLILRDMLGSDASVNFQKNEAPAPVRADAFLDGIGDGVSTWFPPSAQSYVFTISGTADAKDRRDKIEDAVEHAIEQLRTGDLSKLISDSRARVRHALRFDVETTEDAAHQFAFFEGLDALDVLIDLPGALAKVTPDDVRRVAAAYLQPAQRNIGWYEPGAVASPLAADAGSLDSSAPHVFRMRAMAERISAPVQVSLKNGLPAIVQRSPLSKTAILKVVVSGNAVAGDGAHVDSPVWGMTTLSFPFLPGEFEKTAAQARKSLATLHASHEPADEGDPAARLEHAFTEVLGLKPTPLGGPLLVAVVGDIDPANAAARLNEVFGDLPRAKSDVTQSIAVSGSKAVSVALREPVAQEQIGYVVPAPEPATKNGYTWRLALYVLSHGYEGRLGKDAIARRGLIYDIDSAYRSDGRNGWITLAMGVDPDKREAMKALLREKLDDLVANPPTEQEIAEAKAFLLGRARSAAESNAEISSVLARDFLWQTKLADPVALAAVLRTITRKDVLDCLRLFAQGTIITVAHGD